MGRDIDEVRFTREDRQRYREKVKRDLEVLRRMLEAGAFETGRKLIGVEVEFYVVDTDGDPDDDQRRTARPDRVRGLPDRAGPVQHRVQPRAAQAGRHRVPRDRGGAARPRSCTPTGGAQELGRARGDDRHHADADRPRPHRSRTSRRARATTCSTSRSSRRAARTCRSRSRGPRSWRPRSARSRWRRPPRRCSCTCRSTPTGFATAWNAAQAAAAAQVAVGANSPFLLGKELWRETRIALFEQSIDTRTEELAAQGVRPRVWFGEKWITSLLDLFDENVRYFPALLPLLDDEEPEEVLERGGVPHLPELVLHNGTVYRWNRPVYASRAASRTCGSRTGSCRPGRRWSTRSPTPPSTSAWCGRWRTSRRRSTRQLSFAAACDNFFAAAKHGIERRAVLAGRRDRARQRTGAAHAVAARPPRGSTPGRSTGATATTTSASSSSGACAGSPAPAGRCARCGACSTRGWRGPRRSSR